MFLKKKYLFFFLILPVAYFFICLSLYTFASFALLSGKIFDYPLITDYQRSFYVHLGYRKIFQNQLECVQYDEDLIYTPIHGECLFSNVEFKTKLNFSSKGRSHNLDTNLLDKNIGIAVLGDSNAMGWGVDDNDTFAAILEKKINRPVYNLAVSSYATEREILSLKKSGLLDSVDTVIIQYARNDYGENINFSNEKNKENFSKFQSLQTQKMSAYSRLKSIYSMLKKGIEYPIAIPFFKNSLVLDWKNEESAFLKIINNYDFLKNKKIILIIINTHDYKHYYINFTLPKNYQNKNISYLNIDWSKEDFYLIDGHLNKSGHIKVANYLHDYLRSF